MIPETPHNSYASVLGMLLGWEGKHHTVQMCAATQQGQMAKRNAAQPSCARQLPI